MQTSAHLDHEELKEIKSDLEPGMQSSIKRNCYCVAIVTICYWP